MNLRLFVPLCCIFLLCACEQVVLKPAQKEDAAPVETSLPLWGLGAGSARFPYAAEQVILGLDSDTAVWVVGYVVGSTYRSLSAATFTSHSSHAGNILISSDSLCHAVSQCVPVELSSSKLQQSFSLFYSSGGYRKPLLLLALPAPYFSRPGLRKVQFARWLSAEEADKIDTVPEEWEHVQVELPLD